MTDSAFDTSNDRLHELQSALSVLKESEFDRAKSEALYTKLDPIFRKQLYEQYSGLAASKSKSENSIHCKINEKLRTSVCSRNQNLMGKNVKGKKSLDNIYRGNQKGAGENIIGTPLVKKSSIHTHKKIQPSSGEPVSKKSNENLYGAASLEQLKTNQVQRRIQQYHENLKSIALLNQKPVVAKYTFLKHLRKMNSDVWKNQKNSSISKLEAHINSE